MGSQVLVPFRGSEDSHRHLKLMGDLGQVELSLVSYSKRFFLFFTLTYVVLIRFVSDLFKIQLFQIVPMQYNPRDESSIKAVMAKANVVINLIGIHSSLVIFKF